jgi:hypothetical protein
MAAGELIDLLSQDERPGQIGGQRAGAGQSDHEHAGQRTCGFGLAPFDPHRQHADRGGIQRAVIVGVQQRRQGQAEPDRTPLERGQRGRQHQGLQQGIHARLVCVIELER